ncbi:MAG: alpha-glucosidase [Terracidiphilus sp.]
MMAQATPQEIAAESGSADPWWKHAVIYEIYPRSFQDSNGDGIGDIDGIISRLDYLKNLGVDAIWISPIYPSPQVDFGYDISDYEGIDPQFGTMADMERLIAEANKRNLRVVIDMVLNHTSDKHPWFLQAASSRLNAKHDWYVWNDGKPGSGPDSHEGRIPPNNWRSVFGGSAWEWVPAVHQFYYHAFYKQQPDLNWRNPEVIKQMDKVLQFWLDRGVAGFRLDAIPSLFEDEQLRDEPEVGGMNAYGDPILARNFTDNLPEDHMVTRHLRALVEQYPGDRILVGETYLPSTAELDKWYGGAAHDELQLAMDMLLGFSKTFDASVFRRYIGEAETGLHGSQPLFVFNNHDNPRSMDRYGDGAHNTEIAKVLAAVLLASRATPLLYQGEEIGMVTTPPARREEVRDPVGLAGWPKDKGRDGERTPMQWDGSPNAGFTAPKIMPWLPIPESYKTSNVEAEASDPDSILNWYKRLIALRRTNSALHDGGEVLLDAGNPDVLAWLRQSPSGHTVVAICNFTAKDQTAAFHLPGQKIEAPHVKTLLKSPGQEDVPSLDAVHLAPFGVFLGEIEE